ASARPNRLARAARARVISASSSNFFGLLLESHDALFARNMNRDRALRLHLDLQRERVNTKDAPGLRAGRQRLGYVNGKVNLTAASFSEKFAPVAGAYESRPQFLWGNLPAISRGEPPLDQLVIALELHAHVSRRAACSVEICPPEVLQQASQPRASKPGIYELGEHLGPLRIGFDVHPRPSREHAIGAPQHGELGAGHRAQIHGLSPFPGGERN